MPPRSSSDHCLEELRLTTDGTLGAGVFVTSTGVFATSACPFLSLLNPREEGSSPKLARLPGVTDDRCVNMKKIHFANIIVPFLT